MNALLLLLVTEDGPRPGYARDERVEQEIGRGKVWKLTAFWFAASFLLSLWATLFFFSHSSASRSASRSVDCQNSDSSRPSRPSQTITTTTTTTTTQWEKEKSTGDSSYSILLFLLSCAPTDWLRNFKLVVTTTTRTQAPRQAFTKAPAPAIPCACACSSQWIIILFHTQEEEEEESRGIRRALWRRRRRRRRREARQSSKPQPTDFCVRVCVGRWSSLSQSLVVCYLLFSSSSSL